MSITNLDTTNVFGSTDFNSIAHVASRAHTDITSMVTEKSTGDASAKEILSNRIVLASILKYAVDDFNNYTVDELISMIPPRHTDDQNDVKARCMATVDEHSGLAKIEFDVFIEMNVPSQIRHVFIDVEAQNRIKPSNGDGKRYDLQRRGCYYLARMLSSQLDTTDANDYSKLSKCYSIWICFGSALQNKESYTLCYNMHKKASDSDRRYYDRLDYQREVTEANHNADMFELLMLYIGNNCPSQAKL